MSGGNLLLNVELKLSFPNRYDLPGAELIRKTKGKIFFIGDRNKILPNIKTDRVTVKQADENTLNTLDNDDFMECEMAG